jgi:hypothetical protein
MHAPAIFLKTLKFLLLPPPPLPQKNAPNLGDEVMNNTELNADNMQIGGLNLETIKIMHAA